MIPWISLTGKDMASVWFAWHIQPFYGESQRHSIQRAINRTDHGMAMGRVLMRTVLWHDPSTNTIDTWHKLNFVKWLMSTAVVVPMVSICASSLVGHWLPVPCFIVAFWGRAWRSLNSHLTAFFKSTNNPLASLMSHWWLHKNPWVSIVYCHEIHHLTMLWYGAEACHKMEDMNDIGRNDLVL